MNATRILFVPDIHVPYHDESSIGIVDRFGRDFKPHRVVMLGDLISADQASSFPKDDEIDLREEYTMGNDIIDRLGVTDFCEGNHEERLRRVGLVKKSLRSVLSPRLNLRIEQRGINWIPYTSDHTKGVLHLGKYLVALHGWWFNEYAARKHAEVYGCCVFGHTHRMQSYQPKQTFIRNTGFNIGCLCKLTQPYSETMPPNGWCQGFAFAYLFDNGYFNLYEVRLIGDDFVINNRVYTRR